MGLGHMGCNVRELISWTLKPLPWFLVGRTINGAAWPIHGCRQLIRVSPTTLSLSTSACVHFCRLILHCVAAIFLSATALRALEQCGFAMPIIFMRCDCFALHWL